MKLDDRDINIIEDLEKSAVKNRDGEITGFIAGVFSTRKEEQAEYIILGCDHLFGSSTRYFAVPASTEMIHVSGETVVLKIGEEDLMQTKRISLEKCPKPLFDLEPLIYELTDFSDSNQQKLNLT